MKKIIFLLFPLLTLAQNPTNFPYGIKNAAATSDSAPAYFTTTQVDGVHKKTPAALVAKVAIVNDSLATKENVANKSDSYTTSSSTTYASTKALVDGLGTKQNTLTNPITGTGASGQVSFWSGSGTQTGDNTFFWDNTNKRLGVGESTPLDVLVVSKTVGANTGQIRFGGANGRTLSAYNNGSSGNFDFTANLSYFSGNLGVGPQKYISMYNYAGTLPNYYQTIIDASENVSFRINGTNAYVISPNRNVLINTTTDNATDKIQVNGTVSSGTTTLGNTPPTVNNQLTRKDYVDTANALKAPLASPTFTGAPTAPTATVGTNDNTIATTAFVQGEKAITVRKISTNTTLSDSDNGKVILLTASCTVTLPNGLMNGFNCSFSTQAGATLTYSLGGSVVLINNVGTTMAEKLSHTIVNTGVSNEYLIAGAL